MPWWAGGAKKQLDTPLLLQQIPPLCLFVACPPNTYKSHPGPLPCEDCPTFSQSRPGSNSSSDCVCIHGEFKQVTNRKYRKCQEFENEEEMKMGKYMLAI